MNRPPIVIDNGTGYTKMGYAGNTEPNYVIPTLIATTSGGAGAKTKECADLDFFIGEQAVDMSKKGYTATSPMSHGIVHDWDKMEKFLNGCIYRCLRSDPEQHLCLLVFFCFFAL